MKMKGKKKEEKRYEEDEPNIFHPNSYPIKENQPKGKEERREGKGERKKIKPKLDPNQRKRKMKNEK